MAKSIIEEVAGYRLKVEKDGKEIVNVPGILALPGVLIAPKISLVGTVAASLLGCSIHLENEEGKDVDVSTRIRKATETVVDTAKETARTIKEEIDKAWDTVSADDPEGCPEGEENEPAEVQDNSDVSNREIVDDLEKQAQQQESIPTIQVNPEDRTEL